MRTVSRPLLTLTLVAAVGAAPAAAAADLPAPTGTAPITGAATARPDGPNPPTLVGIRYGRHDAYDRTVFDFSGGTPGYRVEYGPLVGIGAGTPIPLTGPADLRIAFDGAFPGVVDLSRTINPALPTLRQIRSGGAFEARILFGAGLADRVGFRVLRLTNPPRIAVDVAHQPTQLFGTTTFRGGGGADRVVVTNVRTGRHPGYDRIVFDLGTTATPLISVAYTSAPVAGGRLGGGTAAPSTLHVGLTGMTTQRGSVAAPLTRTFDLPQLRGVSFTVYDNGTVSAFVTTQRRTGFRVMLLSSPTRIAVDVRH
jgi:hypothetical protein